MSPTPLPLATTACCGIGVDGGLSREEAQASATLLKAVADFVRLRLLSAIRAGMRAREKRGTWAWFRLVPNRIDDVAAIFR